MDDVCDMLLYFGLFDVVCYLLLIYNYVKFYYLLYKKFYDIDD